MLNFVMYILPHTKKVENDYKFNQKYGVSLRRSELCGQAREGTRSELSLEADLSSNPKSATC